jgi:hypothetical protein
MNEHDIKRLALILSVQAEIEGMKAENLQREDLMQSLAYNEGDFQEKAENLRILAYCHNEQL